MKHLTIIAGARPNFMKIAPIIHEIQRVQTLGVSLEYNLVHTGQHYDQKMSGAFFEQLGIPCLLYTSPSPRDRQKSRMPSSA